VVPYDRPFVGPLDDQVTDEAPAAGDPERPTASISGVGTRTVPVLPDGVLTAVAFTIVAVPFAYAALRLATASTAHLTLPDDLALIDLHVRRALAWKQQLGVFDHYGWNHPGPSYFYLQSVFYRVLGSNARSLFVGATLLNGLSAMACVAVVRRRTTAERALWAALWVCVLAAALATGGASATTYSESVLGALVSPWNPTVVLFPLLLVILLSAGALDRSGVSLVGALVVGSYVVQTDVSTAPLVLVIVVAAGLAWLVTSIRDRRHPRSTAVPPTSGPRAAVLATVGLVVFVVMWLPPLVQQFTNHPGNLTLIARFFDAGHPGQPVTGALWAVAAGAAVLVIGPGEIMASLLGGTPSHAALAVAVLAIAVVLAGVTTVAAGRRRARFAFGVGALTLLGLVTSVVAVTHVVGFIFGYLVLWIVVLPVAALISIGMVPRRPAGVHAGPRPTGTGLRATLCVVALVVGVVACVRVAAIPPLARAGDPAVGRLAALVVPHLAPGQRVAVGDAGAGTTDTLLLDVERFVGLVDALDRAGYHPTVNKDWKLQLGPGYLGDGTEPRRITLTTWTPSSAGLPGYVGHVGDMAVTVTDRSGTPAPPTG
jgi:hypothetical protein